MKNSKILFLTAAVGTALVFSSCDKAKVEVDFDLKVADLKLYIDTTSKFGSVDLAAASFQSELQKTLDDNNASIDDVESISLTNTELVMLNPGAQNFDIIDKVYGLMSATGLGETQVAYLDPVPDGVTSVKLLSDGADLKEYLKQAVINFKVTGFSNGPNTERDTLEARLTFNIKAKIKPI